MIKTFKHKGLRRFFEEDDASKIQPHHAKRLREQLSALDEASKPEHMDIPGYKWHKLTGDRAGQFSVWVNGNWRITFKFEGQDAILVHYEDYH